MRFSAILPYYRGKLRVNYWRMQNTGVVNMIRTPRVLKYTGAILCIMVLFTCLISCTPREHETPVEDPEQQETPTPGDTPSTAPPPSAEAESLLEFYPLKEGNMWEYEGEGMEYASAIQKVVFSSGNRHQVTVDNGGTVMASVLEAGEDSIVNTFMSGEIYDNENLLEKPSNVNIILLQTPLEKGNFWISEENHYEIIDTAAEVVVPAGEFSDCIAVRETFKDQTSNMIYYYKKGIGMVQSEFRTNAGDMISSKLKRYELK